MKIHRELSIRGPKTQLLEFIEDVSVGAGGTWRRDRQLEKNIGSTGNTYYCFSTHQGKLPCAALWLTYRDAGTLYVTNVTPFKAGQLSFDEYNAIVEDFHGRFVEKYAPGRGLSVEFGEAKVKLTHWLSPASARMLRAFSQSANKSTGSSHPSDKARWQAFIIGAHIDGSGFDESLLARWLIEEGGWDEDRADQLSIEYEQGRMLLEAYKSLLDQKAA